MHESGFYTANRIVDPIPEKVWIRKKAEKRGVFVTPLWKEGTLSSVLTELEADVSNPLDWMVQVIDWNSKFYSFKYYRVPWTCKKHIL